MDNSHPYLLFLVALGFWAAFTTTNAGSVYKWVDESGNVHYGQQPMSDSAEKMTLHSAPPAKAPKQVSEDNVKKKKVGKDEYKAYLEKKAANDNKYQEKLKIYCDKLNIRLEAIQRGGRMYVADKSGERTYWDDNKRQTELTKAQENIANKCSG